MRRIAIPCHEEQIAERFGLASQVMFFDTDPEAREIRQEVSIDAPPEHPDVLPGWIAERGAHVVLAPAMIDHAREVLVNMGIRVILGVAAPSPHAAVEAYLRGEYGEAEAPVNKASE